MSKPTDILTLGTDSSGRPIKLTVRMKAAFDKACEKAGTTPTVVQGAFQAGHGAAASAGYHDRSGCLDIRLYDKSAAERRRLIRAFRSVGWAYWERDARHGMDLHAHMVLLDEPNCASGAVSQMAEYRAGGDGLAGSGADYHWRPSPIPTFHYQEDEVTDDDIDKIAAAVVKRLLGTDLTPHNDANDRTVRGVLNGLAHDKKGKGRG